MVTIGARKLFEEIDRSTEMRILSENSEAIEIEASWVGDLKSFNGSPDGNAVGPGSSG